jgi:hypothetical protein
MKDERTTSWVRKFYLPIIIAAGLCAYVVVDWIEQRPYSGPTEMVVGEVKDVIFRSRGTMTAKSYVQVQLSDGMRYRLNDLSNAALQVGSTVEFVVPVEQRSLEGERLVLSSRIVSLPVVR